jgi:hypothetical protein
MGIGYRVSGIGEEKIIYSPISLSVFFDEARGSAAFPRDDRQDVRRETAALRAIISRATGGDRANFHFSRASREKSAPA